jgi:hypothetical protein
LSYQNFIGNDRSKKRAEPLIDIYDPERLLAQAAAWRAAAEKAPPKERDIYLSQALDFEIRVERSLNTPVLKDRNQSKEVPASISASLFWSPGEA